MADYTSKYKGQQIDEAVGKALNGGAGSVSSVNGQTGDVRLDVPNVPSWAMQSEKPTYTASEVGALPSSYTPPTQTAAQVGADPAGTASATTSAHNTDESSHNDIRGLIADLKQRLDALMDCDDTTLDQISEIVSYIKNNKSLIDGIATGKVSVTDVINNLTTNATNKPLSAAQGVVLKKLIDQIVVPTKVSTLENDSGYLDASVLSGAVSAALLQAKESGKFDGVTPQRGVDYWTDLDQLSIVTDAVQLTKEYVPTITASKSGKATTLTIVDKEGTKTATINDGADGMTPVKGTDYWTADDQENIMQQVNAESLAYISTEMAKRGQLKPEFANSIQDCTDTTKLYVLPDGYIYAYMRNEVTTPGSTTPNFTNLLTDKKTVIRRNVRYSQSSAAFKDASGCDSVIVPIPTSGNVTMRFRGCGMYVSPEIGYPNVYGGKDFNGVSFATTIINATSGWIEDSNGDYHFSFTNSAGNTCIVFMTNTVDTASDIVTANQEITYTTTEDVTTVTYEWESTGHAFVPADYEDRIITLETEADTLNGHVGTLKKDVAALKERPVSASIATMVYAPSPQLPADGSEMADFNAANINANEIYAYIDALAAKYPQCLTKETLGKDASGTYDWNRYTVSRRTYDAWVKPTHPAMYAWANGSTVIYSVSVSPRVGDTMYSTAYIGTAYGTVTAVDTPNQARTVNGLVFSRDKTRDVAPTLVYTLSDYSPYRLGAYATWHNTVYNASRASIGKIASIANGTLTDSNGNAYQRYPMGDRNKDFKRLPVLVIGSNEHGGNISGDPAEAAIITARLIKDLCECRNADNPFLNMLKSEYTIVFCPVINPWGYGKESGYVNANGVNLDRNFDTPGWGKDSDTRHGAYGGSENETQYFMATLVESGAKIAMANHVLGSHINADTGEAVNAGICSYMLGRNQPKYNAHLSQIAETMNVNYGLSMYDMGQAPGDTYGKTRSYMDHIGIEGGAVEMSAIEGYLLHGGARHTAMVMEADYTLLLQFLQMLIDCQEE